MKYLLLCVLLLLFSVSLTGLAKEGFIFFYDFKDEVVGKPPSEPWRPTAVGEVKVEELSGNKVVKITDSGSGGGMTLLLDSPIKDKTVSLEFRWMREEGWTGSGVEVFYVLNQKCADDWSGVCISTEGVTLQYNDSGNWVGVEKIKDGTWHDLKYVMYVGQKRYDFYYDGNQLAKNAGFRKYDGVDGIDKFNAANVGDGGTTFVMYFDDIMLYEGTVKPLSVERTSKLAATWGLIKQGV